MNTTRADVLSFTRMSQRFLSLDLKAIPVEQQGASPGGCARTPLNIVAECARTNGIMVDFLLGTQKPRLTAEERIAFLNSFDDQGKVLTFLDAETDRLVEAIEGLDEATMSEPRPGGFFGEDSSPLSDAQFGAIHMMYHVGQLNYIQSIYGDGEMHWWE